MLFFRFVILRFQLSLTFCLAIVLGSDIGLQWFGQLRVDGLRISYFMMRLEKCVFIILHVLAKYVMFSWSFYDISLGTFCVSGWVCQLFCIYP